MWPDVRAAKIDFIQWLRTFWSARRWHPLKRDQWNKGRWCNRGFLQEYNIGRCERPGDRLVYEKPLWICWGGPIRLLPFRPALYWQKETKSFWKPFIFSGRHVKRLKRLGTRVMLIQILLCHDWNQVDKGAPKSSGRVWSERERYREKLAWIWLFKSIQIF